MKKEISAVHDPGTLSLHEMRAILQRYKRPRYVRMPNDITLCDITNECKLQKNDVNRIANGLPTHDPLGRVRLRRLSNFLRKLEAGLVIKRKWQVIYLSESDAKPPPPQMIFSLSIPSRGGPVIRLGAPIAPPKSLPNIFKMAEFLRGSR